MNSATDLPFLTVPIANPPLNFLPSYKEEWSWPFWLYHSPYNSRRFFLNPRTPLVGRPLPLPRARPFFEISSTPRSRSSRGNHLFSYSYPNFFFLLNFFCVLFPLFSFLYLFFTHTLFSPPFTTFITVSLEYDFFLLWNATRFVFSLPELFFFPIFPTSNTCFYVDGLIRPCLFDPRSAPSFFSFQLI